VTRDDLEIIVQGFLVLLSGSLAKLLEYYCMSLGDISGTAIRSYCWVCRTSRNFKAAFSRLLSSPSFFLLFLLTYGKRNWLYSFLTATSLPF
jgi:hypothetical protein